VAEQIVQQMQAGRPPGSPEFARWPVLVMAGVVLAAHLVAGSFGGLWTDEAYMLAIGRAHLDWGSADQPPMAPLLAALMDWLAPGSALAVHLPAALATAGAVILAAMIAREIGGDRRAQILTAAAQATAAWASLTGHFLTPYSLAPAQWLLLVWLLVRWLRSRDDRLLLASGLVAGLAAQTKIQVFLLCAALLLGVLAAGPRALLRRPMLWAGVAIATVIAAPTLVWQAAHGWPQLEMAHHIAATAQILYGGRPGIAAGLIGYAGLAGTVLALYGLWRLLRSDKLRDHRFLAVTFLLRFRTFRGDTAG
jgi:4-amino-4-deoxy-L-arabinose transferase-like glycosyltransferase